VGQRVRRAWRCRGAAELYWREPAGCAGVCIPGSSVVQMRGPGLRYRPRIEILDGDDSQPAARNSPSAAGSASRSAAAAIWCTRESDSPAAADRVRIEIPSARAETGAHVRSRSACSSRHAAREGPSSRRPAYVMLSASEPRLTLARRSRARRLVCPGLPERVR
jgi:hypothetical protein